MHAHKSHGHITVHVYVKLVIVFRVSIGLLNLACFYSADTGNCPGKNYLIRRLK